MEDFKRYYHVQPLEPFRDQLVTISKMTVPQGRHNFGVIYLPRLAKALKVSVTAFFFDAE